MRTSVLLFLACLFLLPSSVLASDNTCSRQKYDQYVQSSLQWYQTLIDLAVKEDKALEEVGRWFLQARQHHLILNQQALSWYFQHQPQRIPLTLPVESWIALTQTEIKTLSQQSNALTPYAQRVFANRQAKPHPQNYQLRTMFALLLTQPQLMKNPLMTYNEKIKNINKINCS